MRPKVYIGKLLSDKKSYLPILYPNLGRQHKDSRLFLDRAYDCLTSPVVDIVENVSEADFLLIPYDFFNISERQSYIREFETLAKKANKKIIIFDFSDYTEPIDVSNALVFRVSQKRGEKRSNVIVMPPFVEDLKVAMPRAYRDKPLVSFMGYAGHNSLKSKMAYLLRTLFAGGGDKPGIYYRRRAIEILSKAEGIDTNFKILKTYSGHSDTILGDPEVVRANYIKSIVESDFVLAPRGNGNYSIRFFEALALGRIPILIDVDQELPMEDLINYEKFIIRVDYKDMNNLSTIVTAKWQSLNSESYANMQKEARLNFEQHLRMDKFLFLAFGKLVGRN